LRAFLALRLLTKAKGREEEEEEEEEDDKLTNKT
jgi:hypothetical protein